MDDIDLETKSFPPSAQLLGSYLRRMFPSGEYYSVYEAGYSGYFIPRQSLRRFSGTLTAIFNYIIDLNFYPGNYSVRVPR